MDPQRIAVVAEALRVALTTDHHHLYWPNQAVLGTLAALECCALGDAERACAEMKRDGGCYECASRFAGGRRDRCDGCREQADAAAEVRS